MTVPITTANTMYHALDDTVVLCLPRPDVQSERAREKDHGAERDEPRDDPTTMRMRTASSHGGADGVSDLRGPAPY